MSLIKTKEHPNLTQAKEESDVCKNCPHFFDNCESKYKLIVNSQDKKTKKAYFQVVWCLKKDWDKLT
jgi:hypothetical protein